MDWASKPSQIGTSWMSCQGSGRIRHFHEGLGERGGRPCNGANPFSGTRVATGAPEQSTRLTGLLAGEYARCMEPALWVHDKDPKH